MKPILPILFLLSSFFTLTAQNETYSDFTVIQKTTRLSGDSITHLWDKINLTGKYMKPAYAATVNKHAFLWWTAGGGIVAGGSLLTYVLAKKDIVNMVDCDFSIAFERMPASCGNNNGRVTVIIDKPGNFTYQWSNGATTAAINNLFAGEYFLTVERDNPRCSSNFSSSIEERPAMHISEIQVVQPTCSNTANIQFTASSVGGEGLMMEIIHPEGSELLAIEPGLVSLVSYVSIVAGDYTITVWDASAIGNCTDSFSVAINNVPVLEIALETVIPPSSPSANDGLITFAVTSEAPEPYTVFLDGVAIMEATGTTITIEGMGIGEHSIQVLATNGCLSNILAFLVPFTGIEIQLGTIITASQFSSKRPNGNREMSSTDSKKHIFSQGISISATYLLANQEQYSRITFFPNYSLMETTEQSPSFIRIEQMTSLFRINNQRIRISLHAGLSTNIFPAHAMFHTYWQTNVHINKKVFQYLNIELAASLRGCKRLQSPIFNFGLFVPI